ncbi:MAG: type VI secretion system protein TssL [Gammaproteobacteria bacterium]|nr:type VI secretion system protein TssL [Gammaproteobacteria bacterium]
MSPDDPLFGSSESRTVFVPTPGRRHLRTDQAQRSSARETAEKGAHTDIKWAGLAGGGEAFRSNPLVSSASVLLSLVSQLRESISFPGIEGLKGHVMDQLKAFNESLHGRGVDNRDLKAAHYALCAFLDETVLRTPWGSESAWSKQSLLIQFHNESWGGEKFFQLLDQASQESAHHHDLLELLFICLSLGFEGKYGAETGGHQKLDQIKENLYRTLRMHLGEFEQDLSPHWRGVQDRSNPVVRYVPLWVFASVTAAILVVMFISLRVSLNSATDPVYMAFNQIAREVNSPAKAAQIYSPSQAPIPIPSLRELLSLELNDGLIDIFKHAHGAVIRLRGDGLFRSGSAEVSSRHHALLNRIADALSNVPGQIVVTGHTDNIPISSMHYTSNWDLSRARAEAVVRLLAQQLGSSKRLVPEGRADTEPLVPNDSSANRARNRRVEISIISASA